MAQVDEPALHVRQGVSFQEMTDSQRGAASGLLKALRAGNDGPEKI
jgi:hypothetical protein